MSVVDSLDDLSMLYRLVTLSYSCVYYALHNTLPEYHTTMILFGLILRLMQQTIALRKMGHIHASALFWVGGLFGLNMLLSYSCCCSFGTLYVAEFIALQLVGLFYIYDDRL